LIIPTPQFAGKTQSYKVAPKDVLIGVKHSVALFFDY